MRWASSRVLLLVSCAALTSCADYLASRDSITLGAGNAMEANVGIHTIDPFPPVARNTRIEGDGHAVARAQRDYRRGIRAAAPAQPPLVTGN